MRFPCGVSRARRATAVAESAYPEFQQRLLTFDDREKKGNDPFLELLAADTLSVARDAQPANLLPNNKLYFLAGAGVACVAVLVWLVAAGPAISATGRRCSGPGPKLCRFMTSGLHPAMLPSAATAINWSLRKSSV